MIKVVLLGANGQLGTDIKNVLKADNGGFELLSVGRNELNVENIDDIGPFLNARDFDFLINCTSYHKTDEVEENPTPAVSVNSHAVQEMAKICAAKEACFIHISTDYVFNGYTVSMYTEEDCPAPLNVYGASKYLGENLAFSECQKTYILRVASLFGVAGSSGKGGNFVETMLRLAKEKGELRVVNDTRMSPTSTAFVARTIYEFFQKNPEYGVYHLVNSGQASWYEFAREIIAQAGMNIPVYPVASAEFPTRAKRPSNSALDNNKIQQALDQTLPHWSEALREYLIAKRHASNRDQNNPS